MPQPVPKNPIINEIESALRGGSAERQMKVLTSVTDLFVDAAKNYTEAETKFFDDVLGHLIKHVESRALIEVSARLAPIENAPINTIRTLARNNVIAVSGPVLKKSLRLSDDDLIDIAKTKSQAHLTNIARRARLNEPVTDTLVDHGDADVANEVAINPGASFSKLTMAKLVMRADGDSRLTESVGRRRDISPAMFQRLMLQATEAVRAKLMAVADPEQKEMIRQVLDEIAAQVRRKSPISRHNYEKARWVVAAFSQDTDLTKKKVLEFAGARRIAEAITALSVLSGVPVDQTEALFQSSNAFGLMVLCKSVVLDWNTTLAVIVCRSEEMESHASIDELREQYRELSPASAQKLIYFWLGRQKVAETTEQSENAAGTH